MKILIVDDSKVARSIIRKQVEALNLEVIAEGKDGTEGLSLWKELTPEIIISDIEMPEMDGISMSKTIREEDKNVKIIILSSIINKKVTNDALLSGANLVLPKPLEKADLKKAIEEF